MVSLCYDYQNKNFFEGLFMSEFLRSNPESFKNEQESNRDIAELAVNGLSRITGKQEDDADNDNYYGEDNYDDGEYDGEDG